MIDLSVIQERIDNPVLAEWIDGLPSVIEPLFDPSRHGSLGDWLRGLQLLPAVKNGEPNLNQGRVSVGGENSLSQADQEQVEQVLRAFHPWRKGPYDIHGIHIDTEWRSDWKWDRLAEHIAPLSGRTVLDVGCGNGYHCWRMLGAGAELVVGIDPLVLNVVQFLAIQRLLGMDHPVRVLPLGIEDLPEGLSCFDTVFSMGVLYHRRSPIDHLNELAGALRPGGQLVLETLVVDGDQQTVLVPSGRYAKMRNVWFIPSCEALKLWLSRCGFKNIRLVDVSITTGQEQRTTDWMKFHSLPDFLDPEDSTLTAEGHPAPVRAVFTAEC